VTESLDIINQRLEDTYGRFSDKPLYRIVWSEDQFENRFGDYEDYDDRGYFIRRVSEVRLVPKYRQWIQKRHVLERLTEVPEINRGEIFTKISYEPIWVFEHAQTGEGLPPSWGAARFVIEQINEQMRTAGYTKYKDPEEDPDEALEQKAQRIIELENILFGDETETGDALKYKQGIVVPEGKKDVEP
jgi:hypothetical protein